MDQRPELPRKIVPTSAVHPHMPYVGPDKRKQSLYFPIEMLAEIQEEATRQDRSMSWIMQRCWELAREDLKTWPTHRDQR